MNVSDSLLACKLLINLKLLWEKLKPWLRLSTGSDGANNRKASYINEFKCDHSYHIPSPKLLPYAGKSWTKLRKMEQTKN